VSNVSHEFNTPISSLTGYAKLLKKKDIKEKQKNEYLDIIITECKRLSSLSSKLYN
jgi:nitrogen-specific signal transduction histidine kinase